MSLSEIYNTRYQLLNPAQRLAVDTTEGPVMVIAGPGTGKTEVLGMRIANLLRSDAQVAPHEILCLTYTEEAAFNMRKRLSAIVGLASQKVNIHTFHGFCNGIIQNHSEYFGLRQMELVSDLEKIEILQKIIAQLPYNNPMHRVGSATFFDLKPLLGFFGEMKKENWTTVDIHEAIDSYLNSLPEREQYQYKRKYKEYNVGDTKQQEIDKETERMNRTRAAVDLFGKYNEAMEQMGRYDYADMILWVIAAFKNNSYLLQHYQERFQYILVDEFQDTNGAQNEVLNLLTSFWGEAANIFVVGDDDQSIYEFQGARIKNIVDFYEKYQSEIKILVLNQNYRSSKAVLEKAMLSIDNNKHRLINNLSQLSLTKKIESALPRFQQEGEAAPIITSYEHPIHEAVCVANQLQALQNKGVSLDSVAIIYAQHRQANYLIQLLERKSIPFTLRKSINVLNEVLVQQILRILSYLTQESKRAFSGEPLLFQLMHCPYFGIAPKDIAQLSIYINSKEAKDKQIRHWRQLFAHEMLLSSMDLASLKQILKLARALDYWLQQVQVLRLPMLLEKIVHDSQIIDWCLKGNNPNWDTQVLTSFFEFVKSVATKDTSINDLLAIVERMESEGIELPLMRIVHQKNGVQLYTAHSAKGLEFEHVFLIGCTSDFWEKKSVNTGAIKLPDTLTRTVDEQDNDYKIEVARRLFYVAITRAKMHLQISYPRQKQDGKPIAESVFITEILNNDIVEEKEVTSEIYTDVQALLQPVTEGYIALVDRSIMEQQLEQFAISASSLAKYLECPISFYYEHVLRIPVAENDTMAFGTAVHYALERAFKEMQKSPDKSFPPIEDVLGFFKYKMQGKEIAFTELQFERRMEKGIALLSQYYADNCDTWQREVQLEAMLQTNIQKVPIKGRIDKIELLADNQCRVVDYKTGNPDQKRTKENLAAPNDANDNKGGNYWRQMVFYKLLIEGQPFNKLQVGEGVFEYLEKNKAGTYTHRIIILPQDEEIVKEQILTTYDRIKRFEFDKGCQSHDCKWCSFVKENNILTAVANS